MTVMPEAHLFTPGDGEPSLRWGVIAPGHIADAFVGALRTHTAQQPYAVASRTPERARAFAARHGFHTTAPGYEALVADPDVDIVYIAAPQSEHLALGLLAIAAGKHVLIEKPMASSAEECVELIELGRSKGLTVMVGHTFLYSEPVRMIKEIIGNGDIGEIRYVNSQRLNLGLFQQDINVTWDLAPHDISIILHILEDAPQVVNCQGNAHITPGIEDVTNMSLTFGGKRFATIQSSWLLPGWRSAIFTS